MAKIYTKLMMINGVGRVTIPKPVVEFLGLLSGDIIELEIFKSVRNEKAEKVPSLPKDYCEEEPETIQ
jgi:bifunctional DNA-binding transcriptional regulator/antitoxin component of YhaV-PrlF toxin-antitoxin module